MAAGEGLLSELRIGCRVRDAEPEEGGARVKGCCEECSLFRITQNKAL